MTESQIEFVAALRDFLAREGTTLHMSASELSDMLGYEPMQVVGFPGQEKVHRALGEGGFSLEISRDGSNPTMVRFDRD